MKGVRIATSSLQGEAVVYVRTIAGGSHLHAQAVRRHPEPAAVQAQA